MTVANASPKQPVMPSNPKGRLYFVDWLRVVLTINVVVMHSMLTYSSDDGAGMWSGQLEAAGDEPVLNAMFWFFTLGGWAFRMMLFFLLAGYFTRRSYLSKGPGRFLWERTVRLLLPTIVYSCLVQPFLYWVSNSSDTAVAAAYAADVEDYGEFYVDALGNDLPVPPPHTMTLGEWYKAYYTEPGLFSIDGPVWFVYNLWWFSVGYVLLMLLVDSAVGRHAAKACHRLTAACKQASLKFSNHSPKRHQKLPALPVSSGAAVLEVECAASTTQAAHAAGGTATGPSQASSSSGAEPLSVIIESAADAATSAPAGPGAAADDGAAATAGTAAAAAAAAAAAPAVDSSNVTTPYPMQRVLLGGACLIMSLWVAQFLVRLVMYYVAAITGDKKSDYYTNVSYYLISFDPAFMPQYIAAYTLGILAQKHNGLQRLPSELGIWCVCSSSLFYVIAWALLWTFEDLRKAEYWGDLPANAPQLLYVLAYGFVEMTFGTVWGVGWVVMFRQMFNSKPKKFGALLIGAAYGVYLIHPIFITLYGRMLEHFEFPTFIVNSIFVAYLTIPSAWLVALLLKCIPGLGSRVL